MSAKSKTHQHYLQTDSQTTFFGLLQSEKNVIRFQINMLEK